MKQILRLASALWLITAGLTVGSYVAGRSLVGWPFNFFNFPPLPQDAPQLLADPSSDNTFNDLFPAKVGGFTRGWAGLPNADAQPQRILYSYKALYFPPAGDKKVFVTASQFLQADAANLLINPSDWRLYSAGENIFYALSPVAYKFTAINDNYQDYTVAFVSGRWNITIECINDQNLIAFVNQYRR